MPSRHFGLWIRSTALAVALVATLAGVGCKSAQRAGGQAPVSTATPIDDARRQQHVASFDQVWNTIREQHWDPSLNGVDWDAARAELRPKVESAANDAEARAAMNELIGRLKQSHFGIIPAETYARVDDLPVAGRGEKDDAADGASNEDKEKSDSPAANGREGESGIWIRVVDDRAIVTRVAAGSAGADAGIRPGWELLSVGKRKTGKVLEAVRAAYAESSMRPAYESLSLQSLLSGDAGETVTARFRDGRGRAVKKQIVLKSPAGNPVKFMNLPTFHIQTEVREAAPGVGYVWITAFMDPANVMPRFKEAIERFKDADGLIIDLRGNPGGIGFMANGMAGYLVDQPGLRLGEMSMRSGQIKFVVNPQPTVFSGPVAVLIDEASMSTSEIMAGGLRDIGRARVFGSPSPGAALPSRVEKLPNGDGFQYAFANYVSAKGDVLEGKGVTPDEPVRPDPAQLRNGVDPVVEAAVRWIRAERAGKQASAGSGGKFR